MDDYVEYEVQIEIGSEFSVDIERIFDEAVIGATWRWPTASDFRPLSAWASDWRWRNQRATERPPQGVTTC